MKSLWHPGYVTILLRIVSFKFCLQWPAKTAVSPRSFAGYVFSRVHDFLKAKGQIFLLRSSLGKHNIQAVKEVYFVLS